MRPSLSIIIPVYNVASYLRNCLDSLLAQSYDDWEAICVNDGSSDNSLAILEEYRQKDSRIKVVDQTNGGVGKARNTGLGCARGAWITFVDPDDTIDAGYFYRVMNKVESVSTSVDFIMTNALVIEQDGCYRLIQNEMKSDEAMHGDVLGQCLAKNWTGAMCVIWNKFVRQDLIEGHNIRFLEGVEFGEDGFFSESCMAYSRHLLVLGRESGYTYRIRKGSAISKWSISKVLQGATTACARVRLAKVCGMESMKLVAVRSAFFLHFFAAQRNFSFRERIEFLRRLCNDERYVTEIRPWLVHNSSGLRKRFFAIQCALPPGVARVVLLCATEYIRLKCHWGKVRETPALHFHTNIPAPYRKHQFEILSHVFPGSVFHFVSFGVSQDRSWQSGCRGWNCDCRAESGWRLFLELLQQRWGTVHVLAHSKNRFLGYAYIISGLIGHSTLLEWNDAGFPEGIDRKARSKWRLHHQLLNWLAFKSFSGLYTAGTLGREWGLAKGYKPSQIINTFFSHDMKQFVAYRKTSGKSARMHIRHALGVSDDKVLVLNISRLMPLKRLVDLAEAFLLIEQSRPDIASACEFVLIGDGDDTSHVPLLEKLKFIKCHLLHQMSADAVMDYYCAADLEVFTSELDIWGLVVNEALSMGVPVICTKHIGAAEIVRSGENGYVVPVRAPREIANCIIELVNDRAKHKLFSENAKTIERCWRSEMGVKALKDWLEVNQ